ncbi:MAG: PilN domain-containing protein [Bradymonadaceae bacterium]|nr:PilN domain-containing protein [Lujinxingiaceae bacterium]
MIHSEELGNKQKQVAQHNVEVNVANKEVSDHARLEAEESTLRQQLGVLDDLERNRTGPVRVFDELQGILSPPRNEEDRFSQLQKNWNVEWDTRRLWLEKFSDKDKSIELEGFAGNADDVAEFLQRLTTARHFNDMQLDFVQTATATGGQGQAAARTVQFRITGKISYQAADDKAVAGQGT